MLIFVSLLQTECETLKGKQMKSLCVSRCAGYGEFCLGLLSFPMRLLLSFLKCRDWPLCQKTTTLPSPAWRFTAATFRTHHSSSSQSAESPMAKNLVRRARPSHFARIRQRFMVGMVFPQAGPPPMSVPTPNICGRSLFIVITNGTAATATYECAFCCVVWRHFPPACCLFLFPHERTVVAV